MSQGVSILIILSLTALTIFFIAPQLSRLRDTLGVNRKLESGTLSFMDRVKLWTLGMKTPLLSGLTVAFTFITTESDQLIGFTWADFLTKEHAAMVTAGLWFLTLWAHFSGLNTAAAIIPIPGKEKGP
jgi:hypothetical protein